jgi:hydrogenase maturation protease
MRARTLLVGLGNPLRGDDGVGVAVARRFDARRAASWDVDVDECAAGGLRLAERLVGRRRAIVVDALAPGDAEPGVVRRLAVAEAARAAHATSTHDADLATALAALAYAGEAVPEEIVIVGVGVALTDGFAERLSPVVDAAADALVDDLVARFEDGGEAP